MRHAPLLLAAALLGILTLQWVGWPPPLPQPPVDQGAATVVEPTTTVSQSDLLARIDSNEDRDSYSAIIERPLFRPDRKPEPAADEGSTTAADTEPAAELSSLDLSAVLITPELASAWVRDPSQPKLRRLRVGDDFQGWSVLDILEDRVLLERQGRRDALILRDYANAPPAPMPVGKAAPRPPSRAPSPGRAAPPKQ